MLHTKQKKSIGLSTDKWEIDSFNGVTMHGSIWDPLVKDFQNRISKYCVKHGNILTILDTVQNAISKRFQIQLAAIRGHVYRRGKYNP